MEIQALKDCAGTRHLILPHSQVSGTYTCPRCSVTYSLIVAQPESVQDIGDPPPPHFELIYASIDAEHVDGHPHE